MSTTSKTFLINSDCVCPWWLAYTFDHRIRHLFHKPERIFAPYLRKGMTALDIGCGMGFFSIGMAHIVGDTGAVIAVDLQQNMLNNLEKRACHAGVARIISCHCCEQDSIGCHLNVDIALTFWMVHEVPDQVRLFEQIYTALKPTGHYLLVEPKIHVFKNQYRESVELARQAGFIPAGNPAISFSRATLFTKS
jgi:ubiquinone/menaquinone biosynthesis C-methylase UbiE